MQSPTKPKCVIKLKQRTQKGYEMSQYWYQTEQAKKKNPKVEFLPFPGFKYPVSVDACLGMTMSQTRAVDVDEVCPE